MLLVRRDEQRMSRRHVNRFSSSSEARSPGCDEVDLVFFMWLLWILGSSWNAVRAEAHAWNTQVFTIFRPVLSLIDSNIGQMPHGVILRLRLLWTE